MSCIEKNRVSDIRDEYDGHQENSESKIEGKSIAERSGLKPTFFLDKISLNGPQGFRVF